MKKIIAFINAENEDDARLHKMSQDYENSGADGLFIYNRSTVESERETFLESVRQIVRSVDIPVMAGIDAMCFEDIKKAVYTGASKVVIRYKPLRDMAVIDQASKRFGRDKLMLEIDESSENGDDFFKKYAAQQVIDALGAGGLLIKHVDVESGLMSMLSTLNMTVYIRDGLIRNDINTLLSLEGVEGVATNFYEGRDILKIKRGLKQNGVEINTFDSSVSFDMLKTDAAGLVPAIVQDYKTGEVLMLAYMNGEAFEKTVKTGVMTYYSRSRQELWVKGETSGHFQYLKSLEVDCDSDTLLARVRQVGAACHTGERSCFYTNAVRHPFEERNPYKILKEVFDVVDDRKKNPRDGSYTNYLFEKGIDKILKKCGEEATEIVIAAKNPNASELKYEIADFLYHMTVLMVECGVDWEDITAELAHRR